MGLIVDRKKPDPVSAIWEEDERSVHFKVFLASGMKQEDVKIVIQDGKLVIMTEATSSHSPSPSSASSSISSFFSFLKKNEEARDTSSLNRPNDGKIEMNFSLPVGVDPDGFSTSMDDAGVLTLTFKRQRAFDLRNVAMGWEHAKDSKKGFVDFKAYLAAGTKIEDLVVVIERGKYLIVGMLQKKEQEGDTSVKQYHGNNFRSFLFPDGVDPFGFSTSMDDAGVLTLTFKRLMPFLSSTVPEGAFENVIMGWDWEHAKDSRKGFVDFKAYLAAGTKIEDLMIGIDGGKYLTIGMLEKKEHEGDTSLKQYEGNNFRSFLLPDGLGPFGYSTSMDDAGILTLTFTILKPNKKLVSKSKLLAGMARVVPACLMIGCEISDKISGDDFY
ncbi:hypothetical protein CISIN_1g016705mg [Citrus sinensis]|uniref:SHSP domain-containing protein n=1 Tax=Citrus sinensis TaxID=2711 RepID=A0A067E4H9_CITSI|nr:hypothetical protein CISIN_1g016705mg [Citrus sinensis]